MKLRQVDNIPNFFVNEDSGIHYVKKMVNGRVVWKTTGLTNRKQAFRRYNEVMTLLNEKKSGWEAKHVPTVLEWWKTYDAAKKKAPLTKKREEYVMRLHILPHFGRFDLDEVKTSHIERYLNWRLKKAKPGTVDLERSLLHSLFEAALDDDIVDKNPLRKVPRIKTQGRTQVLSEDDQDKLLAIAPLQFNRWLQFLLGTGLRFAELQHLSVNDIDWDAPSVHVLGKGSKERDVPLLSPLLVQLLQDQLADNNNPSTVARIDKGHYVWPQSNAAWRSELKRLTKKAGISFFSPHILRHSFATRYLQSGGDIYVLSKILGHASVTITEKVYAHLIQQDHARLSAHVDLKLLPVGRRM